jgi:hypothetical protein
MALFVDGPATTIDDLTDQDSALLDVAQTNGVNLTTKLRLAMAEIRSDLELWLLKPRPTLGEIWSPALRVEQLVVTPTLARWETMRALELVYRDVYFTQVVDRYQAKWQGYMKLAGEARESFLAAGLAGVSDPLPRPLPPLLTSATGVQPGGLFYASVAWVNAAGQEGQASAASSITIADGNVMIVAATGPPSNAIGYRVYAGTLLNGMLQQNPVALPVGAAFAYLPGQVTSGTLPGAGQKPDFIHPVARTQLRG